MAVRFSADLQGYSSTSGLPGTSYTGLCWGYLVSDRNAISTFWVHDASGVDGHQIATTADGVTLSLATAGAGLTGSAMTVGVWHRIALTMSGTTGTLYQSAAGAALTSVSGTVSNPTFDSMSIGQFPGGGDWLDGRLANLKVYSAALTQTEIETELWSWAPVRTANLLRAHPFYGASTADSSGNGNTLTGGSGTTAEAGPPIPPPSRVGRSVAVLRTANF